MRGTSYDFANLLILFQFFHYRSSGYNPTVYASGLQSNV
jgi:hypothetical protein